MRVDLRTQTPKCSPCQKNDGLAAPPSQFPLRKMTAVIGSSWLLKLAHTYGVAPLKQKRVPSQLEGETGRYGVRLAALI